LADFLPFSGCVEVFERAWMGAVYAALVPNLPLIQSKRLWTFGFRSYFRANFWMMS